MKTNSVRILVCIMALFMLLLVHILYSLVYYAESYLMMKIDMHKDFIRKNRYYHKLEYYCMCIIDLVPEYLFPQLPLS